MHDIYSQHDLRPHGRGTGSTTAIVAHVVTNLALGIYVLTTDNGAFCR